jgi:hypothetical protein
VHETTNTLSLPLANDSDEKNANRNVGVFGWEIAHEAVSRRPPIPLYTIVARYHMYTHDADVWDLSNRSIIFCRPVPNRTVTDSQLLHRCITRRVTLTLSVPSASGSRWRGGSHMPARSSIMNLDMGADCCVVRMSSSSDISLRSACSCASSSSNDTWSSSFTYAHPAYVNRPLHHTLHAAPSNSLVRAQGRHAAYESLRWSTQPVSTRVYRSSESVRRPRTNEPSRWLLGTLTRLRAERRSPG